MSAIKHQLLGSVGRLDDASPGGIIATAMRYLANAAPTATGMTMISPEGVVRYISREEADRFVKSSGAGEVRQ